MAGKSSFGESIGKSNIFRKALLKAEQLLKNPGKALDFLSKAFKKKSKVRDKTGGRDKTGNRLNALLKMLKAYFRGEYKEIPKATILKFLAAIIYFVWIVDLIPDFLIGFGYLDDAALLAWVVSSFKKDLNRFEEWEQQKKDK